LSFEVSIDRLKQYRRQFVLFQKMTSIQYRGFIRQIVGYPAEPCKHRILSISYRVSSICQIEPILHAVNAKHFSQHHWLSIPAIPAWDNAVQCAAAILTTVLSPFHLA